jgi:hypothetical protein
MPIGAYLALLFLRERDHDLLDIGQHGVLTIIYTLGGLLATGVTYKLMIHSRLLENVFHRLVNLIFFNSYIFALLGGLLMYFLETDKNISVFVPFLVASSGVAQGVISNYFIKLERQDVLLGVSVASVVISLIVVFTLRSIFPVLPFFIFLQSQLSLFILFIRFGGTRLRYVSTHFFHLLYAGRWFIVFSSGDVLFNIFFVQLFNQNYSLSDYGGFLIGKQLIFALVTIISASISSLALPYISSNLVNKRTAGLLYLAFIVSTFVFVLIAYILYPIVLHYLGIQESTVIKSSVSFHIIFGLTLPLLLFPLMYLNAAGNSRLSGFVEISRRIVLIILFAIVAVMFDLDWFLDIANILLIFISYLTVYLIRFRIPNNILYISSIYALLLFIFVLL